MSCDPKNNTLNPGIFPGIPIPNFGLPISPIQIPIPNFTLPSGIPEDLLGMINSITAVFPSSTFKPNLDDISATIMTALGSIFNQIAPFLSLYNFFQAMLNLILCIIDVLCALMSPWKLFKAIRKLFKRCLPDFLRIFPFMALLAMIISILLLILALIEYIINKVIQLINDLIENLKTLGNGLTLQDDDAITATAIKIAQLLCLIDNLFATLVAIATIIQIIQSLANFGGRSVCGGGGGPSAGDDSDCCSSDVCPPFIHDQPDGFSGLKGQLIYYNQINTNVEGLLGLGHLAASQFNLAPQRPESWQFINTDTHQVYSFSDIITPINDGDIFWPEGITYTDKSKPSRVPYSLDMIMHEFDPSPFLDDPLPARDFKIIDVIVYKQPYIGVLDQRNNLETTNATGTLALTGGTVYHKPPGFTDYVPYIYNGSQATLETLIHRAPLSGILPVADDGYVTNDIEFTLNIHHEVLIKHSLITLGCMPDLFTERVIMNASLENNGFDPPALRLPTVRPGDTGTEFLPDAIGTHDCVSKAMQKFRANVNEQSALVFQAEVIACLEEFKRQTTESYCNILKASVSIFNSTVEFDNNLQFTTRPITATVIFKDNNNTNIGTNIESGCISTIESLLDGYVSLGELSDFVYDGYSLFTAKITSDVAGDGKLYVSYNGDNFKRVIGQDDDNNPSSIQDLVLDYTFVSTGTKSTVHGADETQPAVRRDNTDISRNE